MCKNVPETVQWIQKVRILWKNGLNFKLKHRNAQKSIFIREIWCSNQETRRFDEKLGDSRENQESWQVCMYKYFKLVITRKYSLNTAVIKFITTLKIQSVLKPAEFISNSWMYSRAHKVGWLVGWLSGVNCHCMQMSLVIRRRLISSADFNGAPFWSLFSFVPSHALSCKGY